MMHSFARFVKDKPRLISASIIVNRGPMTYPILEFDPTPEAFIEPVKVIRARAVPEQ
jgi:hypothetical protein